MKTGRLIILEIIFGLVLAEAGLHLGYYVIKGRPIWVPVDSFIVRPFTVPVADRRYITLRANYTTRDSGDAYDYLMTTDAFGFRKGLNRIRQDVPNIAVLGDSVPFGMNLDDAETMPSRLQALLDSKGIARGVINAAIPSYSLDQAVQRYVREIKGKFPVDTITVQAYDPVEQFVILGRAWDTQKNWVTTPCYWQEPPLLRYSALFEVAEKVASRYFDYGFFVRCRQSLDPSDDAAFRKFTEEVDASLDTLRAASEGEVRQVLLLPITVPLYAVPTLSPAWRKAIAVMNETLRLYASSHPGFGFINTVAVFAETDDNRGLFVDNCCHLSLRGANLEAELIAERLGRTP